MKSLSIFFLLLVLTHRSNGQVKQNTSGKPPAIMTGHFVDDYDIHYAINDTVWLQLPKTKFHIIKWNAAKQYILAKNDRDNPGEGGLYTRIDYVQFTGMEPWKWGYCLTVYNAESDTAAEAAASAERDNPKKGCNGYPFSRMKAAGK